MSVKAEVKLDIEELGLEARVTLTPSAKGHEVSPEAVLSLLRQKGVKEGVALEAIEKACRSLAPGKPLTFVAARGVPPRPAEVEKFTFEAAAVPPRLQAAANEALARAKPPAAFRVSERRVQKQKKVLKKPSLPFLPPKEVVETVVERQLVREPVTIDPRVLGVGYVRKGEVAARAEPGAQGRDGRSVFGKPIPAPRQPAQALYLGEGVTRAGPELRATVTGLLRRGDNWCDLVPFQDHELSVSATPDRLGGFLSFTPGPRTLAAPTAAEVLALAVKAGLPRARLLPEREVQRLLDESLAKGTPIDKAPLVPTADAAVKVQVSADKLRATLSWKKGKGTGKRITLAEVSNAIRASGVRGFDAEKVKSDLTAFYNGPQEELGEYLLAEGRAPGKGTDGRLEWAVRFAGPEQTQKVRAQAQAAQARLAGLKSLADFPLAQVQAVARVEAGQEILRVIPATAGEPGVDVYKALVPGRKGAEPQLRLFEGLKLEKGLVTAVAGGLLERGAAGGAVLLRVRQHRDAELQVSVSEDRMQARVTFFPAEGTGRSFGSEELQARLAQGGVSKGVDPARFAELAKAVREGRGLKDLPIAAGRPPKPPPPPQIAWAVRLAAGTSVTITEGGRADFRNQDKLTSVKRGELLATLSPPGLGAEDGWDVSGKILPANRDKPETLTAGEGVRAVPQPDGNTRFVAAQDGELFCSRGLLEVKQVHVVEGDIGLDTGNLKFTGVVQVRGSVQSGFRVEADGDVLIEGTVQAAEVRSGGNLTIRQGVKGEGKASLTATRGVEALFAEQAAVHAGEDVRIKNACVRCQVRCNGRFTLVSERGNLIGGRVQARRGVSVLNLGSPSGTRTEVSFGQDYLLLDKIEQEQAEGARLTGRVLELKQRVHHLERPGSDRRALELAVAERHEAQEQAARSAQRLAALQEQYKRGVPALLEARGVLYPGVVVESRGRTWTSPVEKHRLRLYFDEKEKLIKEKI